MAKPSTSRHSLAVYVAGVMKLLNPQGMCLLEVQTGLGDEHQQFTLDP